MTQPPTEAFYFLHHWLMSHDMKSGDVEITIRPTSVEAEARFRQHWNFDQVLRWRELGHKDPEAINFPTEGFLYGIPFKIEPWNSK